MSDEITILMNEVEQLFMQDDRDSAEYVVRKFVEKKLEACRKSLRAAQRNNESLRREAGRAYRASQDYVPYPENDHD